MKKIIDKTIEMMSPEKALKRAKARESLSFYGKTGAYKGANKKRKMLQNWKSEDGDANTVSLPDLPLLRTRSRDLTRNTPLALGAVNTVVTNIVGTGLRLQSRIDREILKPFFKNDEALDKWERQAERIFNLWAKEDCDISKNQNFTELQSLALRSCLESGDVFIIKRWCEENTILNTSLQLVEADRIADPYRVMNKDNIYGGVELDKNGKAQNYYIWDKFPEDYSKKNKAVKVPAYSNNNQRQVFHLYFKSRPDLVRGIPYLSPVIETFKQLDRYSDSEIASAIVSSMFTVFVKSDMGEGLSTIQDPNDRAVIKDDDYQLGTGAVLDLQPNESIEIADPKRPNTAFDPFVQAILRQIGVALELPFEVLIKHFTASYSAAQASLLEAWKFFSSRRKWLADNFCQPFYELVITEAISKGLLEAPNFFANPIIKSAYLQAEWIGPPRGQIDQLKEVKASKMRVECGITTLSEETAQLTGGDWEQKHSQRIKEHNLRVKSGLEESIKDKE